MQVFFRSVNGNRLTGKKHRVNGSKGVFFKRLHIDRAFLDIADFFTLKAIDDNLRIKRRIFFILVIRIFLCVEVYNVDFRNIVRQ